MATQANVDVLIVGGGLGGVAAALAAASMNVTVMLIEPTNWLGGQLTAQGVCTPDEDGIANMPVIDSYGSTQTYRNLRHAIREWYRTNATLSSTGQAEPLLNMGGCWVNFGFAVEPAVAIEAMSEMLTAVGVTPIFNAKVSAQPIGNGRLAGPVTIVESDGTSTVVTAKIILDATETGDLLPIFGLPFNIGWEGTSRTGEPTPLPGGVQPPADDRPDWIQAITYPFALIRRPVGENHTIAKPDGYDTIKAAQAFSYVDGSIGTMTQWIKTPNGTTAPLWTYRRVIDSSLFQDPNYAYDVSTINVRSNDFLGGIYPDDSNPGNNAAVLHNARQASLCYIYWLQTEAARDDGPTTPGWPELMPATGFFNTGDGICPYPYIRESRRIRALYTVVQQNIDADYNQGSRAALFKDSCGIGNYGMDVHAGANGAPEVHFSTLPFQIPTGALIPSACDNLLASGKCLGVTHVTNGAYRIHPTEWNIGESAGTLAAFCVHVNQTPAAVFGSADLLVQYQNQLLNRGVPLFWWSDIQGHPFWNHIMMAGTKGAFTGDPDSLAFRPDDPFDDAAKAAVQANVGKQINWPAGNLTRAQAAQAVAIQMGWIQ